MNAYQPPSSEVLVDIYRRMALIKQNDERFRAVIKSGKLVMPYYSPRGQEVIPSAMSVCLTDDDYICTIYRGVHDMIAKGVPLKELWAELGGRVTGTCKGKGGPMHVTHPASGVMVTTGIVGSSMPIANGLALAAQIRAMAANQPPTRGPHGSAKQQPAARVDQCAGRPFGFRTAGINHARQGNAVD